MRLAILSALAVGCSYTSPPMALPDAGATHEASVAALPPRDAPACKQTTAPDLLGYLFIQNGANHDLYFDTLLICHPRPGKLQCLGTFWIDITACHVRAYACGV